ncbi:MAG: metalloregulator ArsR/SmtB family transcription factor [Chloroherpetonaceae bacterium]|nr:metalloregulator ArsR/SmtB family transcription factor [Chloroherpetonaceae bacterium]MCS7210766.1 metalloregulator ArsR/SmtB family transcription factor [Chloroherpetonaceae bacterium]MDW8019510.1 metalloregulator ArsR/SmtB family transcription factor [Chloroherpetonaceae bacterium]MDW8466434.1 metalloregulator ArsR/SmtB family transcription factor [Chloroherpetonaceae bacterium]
MPQRHSKYAAHVAEMTDEKLAQVAARFRVLGEPARLKILRTICSEEKNVQQIVAETQMGQANVSKHLSLMYEHGIVERRKEGLNCYYRLADDTIFEICQIASKGVERNLLTKLRQFQLKT